MVATVTGNLVAVTGSARSGVQIKFEPRSLPLVDEGLLVVSPSMSVTTDENGEFTAALVAGDYRLVVGDDESSRFIGPHQRRDGRLRGRGTCPAREQSQ